MKTLADFKRALTIGSKWHTFHNDSNSDMGIGVVVQRNTVGAYFLREGKERPSFMDFPKADLFEVNEDGSVSIFWPEDAIWNLPRRKVLTYKQVEA
jgi:hypothetical protein